jgi:hypothetical protein
VPILTPDSGLPSDSATSSACNASRVTISAEISFTQAAVLLSIDRSAAPELQAGLELDALTAARTGASRGRKSGRVSQSGSDSVSRTDSACTADTPAQYIGPPPRTVRLPERRVGGVVGRYCGGRRRSELVAVETVVLKATVAVPVATQLQQKWSHVLLPLVRTILITSRAGLIALMEPPCAQLC